MIRGNHFNGKNLPSTNYRTPRSQFLAAASNFSSNCYDAGHLTWTNCCNSARTSLSLNEEPHLRSQQIGKIDQMPMTCISQSNAPYYTRYLEGKVSTIQEQNQSALMEVMSLRNQLSEALARSKELEEKAVRLEEALRRERQEPPILRHQAVNTEVRTFVEANTSTTAQSFVDRSVQTMPSEEQQATVVECNIAVDDADLISISKSELEALENDMKILRDVVKAKEEVWEQTLEREQSFREHLIRLSVELITMRQLSDSRYEELQRAEEKLTDKLEELRSLQKDLASSKKTIVKLQKRQRLLEDGAVVPEQPSDNSETKLHQEHPNLRVPSPLTKQRKKYQ